MNRGNKSVSWNDKLDLEVFDIWYLRNRADTLKSDSNQNTLPFPKKSTE